jgi:hypothetical protein
MENFDSPSGRFVISITAWEVRMSLWIETPTLSDRSSGQQLMAFKDSHWSLNSAEWLSESVVILKLRKHPGNHIPPEVVTTIDCIAGTAEVEGKKVDSLAQVERFLDEALVWRQPALPLATRCQGLFGFVRALFGGPSYSSRPPRSEKR